MLSSTTGAFSGWGIGADPADSVQYFYTSEINEGVGDPELDKFIASIYEKESHEEQLKMAAEAEKQHMEKVAIYFPYANGPSYAAVKEKLANYGPSLFATQLHRPQALDQCGLAELKPQASFWGSSR